ncbi:hypothetical protein ACFFUP_00970 [Vibrio ostreicida]|uniref:Uncharacterized protein n=1 Tax=Vibrio ostreicida TaxID=526588 RepID=A0ABT8BTD8_9VIBR|nr:hypothetical protein [Vibrio ostreicida]MDN3610246.1 hypothetical protein [Vibrio ostreicida]NPD07737.1 hypothetical protein [Vibrio ostreicida]
MPDKYDIPNLYLMARFYGKSGASSKFFPLPHETLVIPALKSEQEYVADNGTTQVRTTNKEPIAISNKHGELNLLKEANAERGSLARGVNSVT